MLKLFNTLTRQLEEFKPLVEGKVGFYNCGATVNNYPHLGNARSAVFGDLLKRYLKYSGYQVKHVVNITDVDDKTIRDSKKAGKKLKDFTDFFASNYIQMFSEMNLELPDFMPRASEHIQDMLNLVLQLQKNGHTYESQGSVYFKISSFSGYGQLAQLDKQNLKYNADKRLNTRDEYDKESVNDFALWKSWAEDDGEVFWDTPFGKGRPGWHLECSAMSMKYLGETFDIHAGGEDLIFPHHTNEIAQSEGATGKKFVNYWLHNAFLYIADKKMSKSLSNFYTLEDIKQKGYSPLILKIILMKTHYRQPLSFVFEELEEGKNMVRSIINTLLDLDLVSASKDNDVEIKKVIDQTRQGFKEALDNDLNISEALAVFFSFLNFLNKNLSRLTRDQAEKAKKFIFELDQVLGFIEKFYNAYQEKLKELIGKSEVSQLLEARKFARQEKDYAKADKLRGDIANQGLLIEDRNGLSVIKLKSFL